MKRRIRILGVFMIAMLAISFVSMAQKIVAAPTNDSVEEPETLTVTVAEVQEDPMLKKVADFEARKAREKAELEEMMARRDAEREAEGITVSEDGTVRYITLDYIRENLNYWFSDYEIRIVTLIVMAEDWIAQSDTIWAAHVWCILDRVGCAGFVHNADILDVLSDTTQFPTWTAENLAKEPEPAVEEIVRDVMARFVYEKNGASEEEVGRVLPSDVHFFNLDGVTKYNHFYEWCWGGEYDPFSSPYNPYEN